MYNILMVSRRIKVGALLPYDKARMKTNEGASRGTGSESGAEGVGHR